MRKSNRWTQWSVGLLTAGLVSACEAGELETQAVNGERSAYGAGTLTACGDAHYDMALLTERLQSVAGIKEELGVERIESCDDAKRFVDAYHRLVESAPSEVPPSAVVDTIEVEDPSNHILGGFNIDALPGMVQLGGTGCGGILINERAILTAAHCVDQDIAPDKNGSANKRIYRFVNGGINLAFDDEVRINIHPQWDGSATHDLAVVKLFAPATFPEFGASDRNRIYVGFGSALDLMWLFARGPNQTNGEGFDVLRYMSFQPDWWGPDHFLKDAGGQRVCRGDSGGPVVAFTPNDFQVVVGLLSNGSELSGECAAVGSKQRAVRLHQKIAWIEDMLDVDCRDFSDGGLPYVRCF